MTELDVKELCRLYVKEIPKAFEFLSAWMTAADRYCRMSMGGYRLTRDGYTWRAVNDSFVDIQNSPVGYGDTPIVALACLLAEEARS